MTRALTIMALIGFLVFGAAATSILGRVAVPASRAELASPVMEGPVPNRASKTDKLAVARLAPAPVAPLQAAAPVNEPLRLAFAPSTPADTDAPNITTPPAASQVPLPPPKPKLAGKPPQKSYALLSDAQIAGIKERLRLSSEQESYWPAVESALRAVARKIHRDATSQSARDRGTDRSGLRRGAAAQIGRHAAVVSTARGPKARSAHARPPDRPGTSGVADLSAARGETRLRDVAYENAAALLNIEIPTAPGSSDQAGRPFMIRSVSVTKPKQNFTFQIVASRQKSGEVVPQQSSTRMQL